MIEVSILFMVDDLVPNMILFFKFYQGKGSEKWRQAQGEVRGHVTRVQKP